jgi:hypothetical protein
MPTNNITSIARPVDLSYPTNRAIAIAALVVMISGAVFRWVAGVAVIQSIGWGLVAGMAVFLAWALGRELDPDHDLSAFVAAGLALIGLFLFGSPSLLAAFWILLLIRILNRTVGPPATWLDSIGILGLAGWLIWQEGWVIGLVTALAFLFDSRLTSPHRRQVFFAGLAALAAAASFILDMRVDPERKWSLTTGLLLPAVCALFIPVVRASRQVKTSSDRATQPLNPHRLQVAQIIALLTGILVVLEKGDLGVEILLPLWAAMLGVSLYRLATIRIP